MNIPENILNSGLDTAAYKRLDYRLSWLIQAFRKRQEILQAGNLASWEPEFLLLNQNFEDLTDVVTELVALLEVQLNQKEQGLISPPHEGAPSSDTPTG